MPSRVIRGEILSSRSLSRVSREADWLMHRLILAVDDYGRCEADPLLMKADMFPRRTDVSADDVAAWMRELDEEGCIQVYEVDGIEYLHLPKWEKYFSKQKRADRSKFPAPPGVEDAEPTPCVYFVQRGDGGPIKVGTTTGLEGRLKSLRTAVPNLVVLRVIEGGDRALEKRLHRQFEADRIDGEWFAPTPALLAYIAGGDGQCPPLPEPARPGPGSLDTSRGSRSLDSGVRNLDSGIQSPEKPADAGAGPAEQPAKKARRKLPETPPPQRFDPEQLEQLRSWAAEHEDLEVRAQAPRVAELAAACLDWARSNQKTSADWIARVRNWIRKDLEIAKDRARAGPGRVVPLRGSRPAVSNSAWDAYPRTETGR